MAEEVKELDGTSENPRSFLSSLESLGSNESSSESSRLLDVLEGRIGGGVSWTRRVREGSRTGLPDGGGLRSVILSPLVEVVAEREDQEERRSESARVQTERDRAHAKE